MTRSDPPKTLFLTTRWTLVHDAAQGGDTEAMDALEILLSIYWQPLYRYLRRQGRSSSDAEDLVQGFFANLLQRDGLRLVDRDRGRFRSFLLASLKNHVASEWQREHRLKRGGFLPKLSVDWQSAETGLSLEVEDARSPDKLYDRDWALAMLDKVLGDMEKEENGQDFSRWTPFLSLRGENLSYSGIAAEFGMSEGAARVAVHRLRKRYRQRLRDEIGRTLADDALVDEEMQALFSALSE